MGRDIPVAFQGGGPHAVVLLDAFNAAPDVSNWVTAGNAMNTLAGQGISVAAPAGGAWSMYTNWEQDGSKPVGDVPRQRAARLAGRQQGPGARRARHRRRRPGRLRRDGHGDLPPRPLPLRRLAVGLPGPVERTGVDGAITAGLAQFGGVDTRNMWGLPQLGRWKWHSPNVHVQLLADNNTRLWVFSPAVGGVQRPRRDDRLLRHRRRARNREFYQHYRSVGGHNGHFDFPTERQPRLGHLERSARRDVG